MPLFAFTIFVSAFLLFQVQPIIARYILPWYGGSPAVWTTCLLFFQVGLLAGYAYAHGLVSFLRERRGWQITVHFALALAALLLLPVTPEESWKPLGQESNPVLAIVSLLASTVGIPYLLLSASGPLFQHWFAESWPGRSPYRLYAVSNAGSILGLLSYPFLVEPSIGVRDQTVLWSWCFLAFAGLSLAAGGLFLRRAASRKGGSDSPLGDEESDSFPKRRFLLWIALSATGSLLLLALTNQICQDVAVVPFFWVVPLALYLLTFVIAFDHARWYRRVVWLPLAAVSVGAVVYLINQQYANEEMHFGSQLAIYLAAIFTGCLVCHGELVRKKPPARSLTAFYLAVALGGALGGVFVNLVAPLIFNAYWELHLGLLVLFLLAAGCVLVDLAEARIPKGRFLLAGSVAVVLLAGLLTGLTRHLVDTRDDSLVARRSFYGILRVYEEGADDDRYRSLYHGRISHGMQYLDPAFRDLATTYYSEGSGVGAAISCHGKRSGDADASLHIGAIGLGVGTLATHAREGDRVRFYEINDQVEELARSHFSYLADSAGEVDVVIGDARISLEEELVSEGSRDYDVLVLDAFSGDSIPLHLLTREAFELYRKHLAEGGILAVHISNLHLDLAAPVRTIAAELGLDAWPIEHEPGDEDVSYYSDWVLLSEDPGLRPRLEEAGYDPEWQGGEPKPVHWTDDYSNLLDVIDW